VHHEENEEQNQMENGNQTGVTHGDTSTATEAADDSAQVVVERKKAFGLRFRTNMKAPAFVSIRFKVGGAFSALFIVVLILGIVSMTRMAALQSAVNELANHDVKVVASANQLKADLLSMDSGMRGFLITGNDGVLQATYQASKATYPKEESSLQQLLTGQYASSKPTLDAAEGSLNKWVVYADKLIYQRSVGQGQEAASTEASGQGDQLISGAMDNLTKLIANSEATMEQQSNTLSSMVTTTKIIIVILTLLALIVGLLFGIPATFRTPRNLDRVTQILKEIASAGGDLRKRVEGIKSKDEVARLADATNELLGTIAVVVRQVVDTSDSVAASAEQLTASTDETARAVNEIAVTAGEFATISDRTVNALDEMNSSIAAVRTQGDTVVGKVQSVITVVDGVVASTERGKDLVEEARNTMAQVQSIAHETQTQVVELEASSKQIARILDTIRDIADQTNLLSLNAAIEAARAGEAGRGFAVVAQEVRKLAEESRGAALEIDSIVRQNQKLTAAVATSMQLGVTSATRGREVTDETSRAFNEIHTSVHRVGPNTQAILSSVEEQTDLIGGTLTAISQVSELMEQVAAGSQQNAANTEESLATVEEIAASAQALATLAQDLQDIVGKFQV